MGPWGLPQGPGACHRAPVPHGRMIEDELAGPDGYVIEDELEEQDDTSEDDGNSSAQ